MKTENKLYTHEELLKRRAELSDRIKKVFKKSEIGASHFAELSGMDIKQINRLLEKDFGNSTTALLNTDTQENLDYYISLLEKMVKVGFLPVPKTYSSHCRKHLINALINYYLERVNNRVPLDSYKDVEDLEPTEAERRNKYCF